MLLSADILSRRHLLSCGIFEPSRLVLVLLGGVQQQRIQGVVIPQNHQELHGDQEPAGQHSLHRPSECFQSSL